MFLWFYIQFLKWISQDCLHVSNNNKRDFTELCSLIKEKLATRKYKYKYTQQSQVFDMGLKTCVFTMPNEQDGRSHR